jgi:hypothetical protein
MAVTKASDGLLGDAGDRITAEIDKNGYAFLTLQGFQSHRAIQVADVSPNSSQGVVNRLRSGESNVLDKDHHA